MMTGSCPTVGLRCEFAPGKDLKNKRFHDTLLPKSHPTQHNITVIELDPEIERVCFTILDQLDSKRNGSATSPLCGKESNAQPKHGFVKNITTAIERV
jgi:hypothetical protein